MGGALQPPSLRLSLARHHLAAPTMGTGSAGKYVRARQERFAVRCHPDEARIPSVERPIMLGHVAVIVRSTKDS